MTLIILPGTMKVLNEKCYIYILGSIRSTCLNAIPTFIYIFEKLIWIRDHVMLNFLHCSAETAIVKIKLDFKYEL